MTNNPHNLKVGQKLWWVPSRGDGENRPVTISAIGSKWATISGVRTFTQKPLRIDMRSLVAPVVQYLPCGKCFLNLEAHEEDRLLERTWHDFYRRLGQFRPPAGVTVDQIRELAKAWGIGMEAKFK